MAAHGRPTVAAILVAAGSGQRLGADVPKAFVSVAGRTLLEHAFGRFAAHPMIDAVVVVAPAARTEAAAELTGALVVAGGPTRRASVAAGLGALATEAQFVLVHDVARPFVPVSVIDAVIRSLTGGADAVVPVLAIRDTVRRVAPDGTLAGVVDRSTLAAVQTPQGFRHEVLAAAHRQPESVAATDDATLVEALGHHVVSVPGADEAFKITTAADVARAEFVLGGIS